MKKLFILFGLGFSVLYSQNVGIGTATPASKLSVSGNLSVGAGYVGTAAPTNGVIIEGRVGIGTTVADEWMVIGANHDIVFHNGGTDAIGFSTHWVSGTGWVKDPSANYHGRIHHDPVGGSLSFIATSASPTTVSDIRMLINSSSGNVGIGTINPTERLHVAGNFRLDNAFMPGNNAGNSGEILVSRGGGNAPVWESVWRLSTVETWTSTANANGWTGAGVTNCNGQILLGGYNTCGSGCTLTKTFTGLPPHSEIMIKVYWWAIDSWDQYGGAPGTDRIRLRIDGNTVSYALPTFPNTSTTSIRATSVSICGLSTYADGGPIPLVGKINHTAGSVTVQVDCLVNEASNNESCGLQMVEIWLK